VVAADGTLVRGAGVAAVTKTGTGAYDIAFTGAVDLCAGLGTLGIGAGATGQIGVGAGATAETVSVETETSTGSNADRAFSLAMVC
jgi:hypothetical protein